MSLRGLVWYIGVLVPCGLYLGRFRDTHGNVQVVIEALARRGGSAEFALVIRRATAGRMRVTASCDCVTFRVIATPDGARIRGQVNFDDLTGNVVPGVYVSPGPESPSRFVPVLHRLP